MSFEYYLKRKKLSERSIETYLSSVSYFEKWMQHKGLEKEGLRYHDILSYIDDCRAKGNRQRTIVHKIHIIRNWLDYHFKYLKPNPCQGILVKEHGRPLPSPLLSSVQVDKMYHDYPQANQIQVRNKVILGLLCYQALDGGEVLRLKMEDVKLEYDAMIIKKSSRSNGRSIKIDEKQKPVLITYIKDVRPAILNAVATDRFIVKPGQNDDLSDLLNPFYKTLLDQYSFYRSPRQLRASVISRLLKDGNLREVQYMVGHRYVSSTERYLINHIDDLQKTLDQNHPCR
jgi:integrase/recombinase XerD